MKFKQTPSQTVGPFFAYGLTPGQYGYNFGDIASGNLLKPDTPGERIIIEGTLFSGANEPMAHAVIETWQADGEGNYAPIISKETFSGFGRFGTGTDPQNRFIFETIKPGVVDDSQAPHIALILFSRGMMHHCFTRIYFSNETEANSKDPLLQQIPADRRNTLIAERTSYEGIARYRFDIHMQGDDETVFLEF
jgi:protocatechuate 3,4-dioxygenase alpha subunit